MPGLRRCRWSPTRGRGRARTSAGSSGAATEERPTTSTRVRPASTADPRASASCSGSIGLATFHSPKSAWWSETIETTTTGSAPQVRVRAQLAEHVEPARALHEDVEGQRVEARRCAGARAPACAARRDLRLDPVGLEAARRSSSRHLLLVVHHQHAPSRGWPAAAHPRAWPAAPPGARTVKVRALPHSLLTSIVPALEVHERPHDREAEPGPAPPSSRRTKRSNTRSRSSWLIPRPVSCHLQLELHPGAVGGHRDPPAIVRCTGARWRGGWSRSA